MLAVGGILLTGLGAAGAFAAEPKTDSVITGHADWYTQAYDNFPTGGYLTPRQDDVTGPQRAPFGTSSHRITIGESSAQTELYRTDAYDGVKVSDLTRLEYSELARPTTSGDRQPVYLRLSVDNDGDGTTDASLFFYPANNSDQQTVVNNQWQHWDVANGSIDVDGDNGGTTNLADYAGAHPDATLVNDKYDANHDAGSLSLIAGGALGGDTDPQTNGEYFVDRVIVGNDGQDTLYDLGGGTESDGGSTDLTVDPAHDQGWKAQAFDDDDYLTPNQTFVDGPAVPPLGGGSLRFSLTTAENPDRVELFRTTRYDGTLLRDVRTVRYSTYQVANAGNATPQQPAYLRFSLDLDGNGTRDQTLFFYPANNGTVQQGTWQTWNAGSGVWGVDGDSGAAASVTLDQYLVAHPDATIVANGDASAPTQPKGGTAFLVGQGGAGQIDGKYYVDDITIGTADSESGSTVTRKRFDLEPTLPTLSVGDVSKNEGNYGPTMTFPVTLSRPVARDVTVDYTTSDGTAHAPGDYTAKSGTLTIPAGSTAGSVSVALHSDRVYEANETLQVTLSSPSNATLSDGVGVGTIVNDDTAVALGLQQAAGRRIQVTVGTTPVRAGSPAHVYRSTNGRWQLVLVRKLDSTGRVSVVLPGSYEKGDRVSMYADVVLANDKYVSQRVTITIR